MEIETMIILSTAHLNIISKKFLEKTKFCFADEYSFIVNSNLLLEHCSDNSSLKKIAQHAVEWNHQWIKFDCDGPVIDLFESFDW